MCLMSVLSFLFFFFLGSEENREGQWAPAEKCKPYLKTRKLPWSLSAFSNSLELRKCCLFPPNMTIEVFGVNSTKSHYLWLGHGFVERKKTVLWLPHNKIYVEIDPVLLVPIFWPSANCTCKQRNHESVFMHLTASCNDLLENKC